MDLEKVTKGWDPAGQTIVIFGGAGVLGGEMACALVKCGANVVILDRDLSRADSLKERLRHGPGSGKLAQADVLSKESLFKARDMIKGEFGKVHSEPLPALRREDRLADAAGQNQH